MIVGNFGAPYSILVENDDSRYSCPMVRMARVVVPGLSHHMTQRGNRRMRTLFIDEDYRHCVVLMAEWCRGAAPGVSQVSLNVWKADSAAFSANANPVQKAQEGQLEYGVPECAVRPRAGQAVMPEES